MYSHMLGQIISIISLFLFTRQDHWLNGLSNKWNINWTWLFNLKFCTGFCIVFDYMRVIPHCPQFEIKHLFCFLMESDPALRLNFSASIYLTFTLQLILWLNRGTVQQIGNIFRFLLHRQFIFTKLSVLF